MFGVLAVLLSSGSALADYDNDFSHSVEREQFSFQDMSQASHVCAGAAIAAIGEQALVRAGLRPIPATLTAVALSALLGTAKEVFIDDYASRSGIKAFWVGAGLAGSTILVLQF